MTRRLDAFMKNKTKVKEMMDEVDVLLIKRLKPLPLGKLV